METILAYSNAKQTLLNQPMMQQPNPIFSQYSPSSHVQQHISASIAAAAQLAVEMHQSPFSYQQGQFDFLKIFTPSTASPSSMANTAAAPSQHNLAHVNENNNNNNMFDAVSTTPKQSLLASSHSADKLLGSSSPHSTAMCNPNTLMSPSNLFLPTNEEPAFYNAMSASFVGRLASKNFPLSFSELLQISTNV